MAIINRIARLFKADFHAVLDQIEEPELLLKQSIREMQNELDITQRRIANIKATLSAHAKSAGDVQASLSELGDEIELCLSKNNEALARGLIRKRLELQSLSRLQTEQSNTAKGRLDALAQEQQEQESQLASIKQQAKLFCLQASDKNTSTDDLASHSFEISDADIEVALLKEKQRLSS